MNKKVLSAFIVIVLCFLSAFAILIHNGSLAILNPKGFIALQERNLIFIAYAIMLSIAIPVVFVTFFIAWKYRAENTKSTYKPDWTGNIFLKSLWWTILGILLVVFCIIVWIAAHKLDPSVSISSTNKPITIEVVALQWKWLFIYPEEHIATINYVQFPVNTPVNFKLTADAPMTTFWIPTLGSQIYAMASMETQLHLMANTIGDFPGQTSEINGAGYAEMRFTAHASSKADFDTWVAKIQKSSQPLTLTIYNQLAKPSEHAPVTYYSLVDNNLYNTIIMKYIKPTGKPYIQSY